MKTTLFTSSFNNQKNRNVIKILICITAIVVLTTVISNVLIRKDSLYKYDRFYKYSEEYDVLFFGASVVNDGVYPLEIWNNYGITSYNIGNQTERLSMTYWTIVNCLDYASPKVIVVDLTAMNWAGSRRDNTSLDHNFLDSVPLSINKTREVIDIFSGKEVIEYLVPLYLYHSRWNELRKDDFNRTMLFSYGANINSKVEVNIPPTVQDYELSRYGDVDSEITNLDKIVELCNERGIKLIFTYMPYVADGGDQKLREFCKHYCDKKGVAYYDMLWLDIIDWDKDFHDTVHLNVYGAIKISDYLGEIISSSYALNSKDDMSPEMIERWNSDFDKFNSIVKEFR